MATGHRSQIKKERNEQKDLRPQAHGRYLKISDTKARIIVDKIKGKQVAEAQAILAYLPHYGARLTEKVLNSAYANGEYKYSLDPKNNPEPEKLYVQEAYVGRGHSSQSRWRLRARAKGRGYRIERQVAHISIILNAR